MPDTADEPELEVVEAGPSVGDRVVEFEATLGALGGDGAELPDDDRMLEVEATLCMR